MFGKLGKRNGLLPNSVNCNGAISNSVSSGYTLRLTPYALRRGQAVLLATLILFVVAAVGAGFILFVQSSMNLSQRARQEEEAFMLAQAGLLFADRMLTEKGADWRPSVTVEFDDFERSRGWHRPDKDNDWYGKYAARQVIDLLGAVQGAGGAFLLKVKYLPEQQVVKVISIGRPAPNSPVFRRLVAYKPIPAEWIWVTAWGDGDNPDPLLLRLGVDDNGNLNAPEYVGNFVRLGQELNWRLQIAPNANRWLWLNPERDPKAVVLPPANEPGRLNWLRLRLWLGPVRLPIRDRTVVLTSTIRSNSDLLWYGTNALQVTQLFAGAMPVLEVARRIQHADDDSDLRVGEDPLNGQDDDGDGQVDEDPLTLVWVYDDTDTFQVPDAFQPPSARPSNFGTPPGSGFVLFPVRGVPRYLDGWERLGGLLPVRWVFNFERRTKPLIAPAINLPFYYAQTRDFNPPSSHYGYARIPEPGPRPPVLNTTTGFYEVNYSDQPLVFRGIYIDNFADRQFVERAPDANGDGQPDPAFFVDNGGEYRPELAQVFDWIVKPPLVDPSNPTQPHPRRRQPDSGWLQQDAVNLATERNTVESGAPHRMAASNFYVPPGVEVRFDVVQPDPQNQPNLLLQRTWLIRHDGRPFRAPDGTVLGDASTTPFNEGYRLVFVDRVLLASVDADNDGRNNEDPIDFRDNDGDGEVDEDPPQVMPDPNTGQVPQIVIVVEGNIRVSGQVAVSVKIVSRGTIYVEGPLYPVTGNATAVVTNLPPQIGAASIELLAKQNVCLNFAAARTPIPPDGLNPIDDRASLLPRWGVTAVGGYKDPNDPFALQGTDYALPNAFRVPERLFADWLNGSVVALTFPAPQDNFTVRSDGSVTSGSDGLVDSVDNRNNPLVAQVTFALIGTNLPLSEDLRVNWGQLVNGLWTLRLVLLHRGLAAVQDPNNPANWQPARNPWTNLQIDLWFDENGNGVWDNGEPAARLYGPAEPMRTFPVASRWYQGDGRPVDPNDPTTAKEWGIMEIAIPPTIPGLLVDRDGDYNLTFVDLWRSLQRMRITITSPVAGELLPQGRTPVRYELAGIKLALYDEQGFPHPIWQATPETFFVVANVHAEGGAVGFVPTDYFDPTAHPSWMQVFANPNATQQALQQVRQWQRLWSLYYLRHNIVRWTAIFDPATLPSAIRNAAPPLWSQLPQSVPILAGQIIQRVTMQTMLWRLANQLPPTIHPDAVRFGFEIALDKLALPYFSDLDPANRLADLLNLNRPVPPVFVEVPRTMFASAWLWSWRQVSPLAQGVLDVTGSALPPFYRAPTVPNLHLSAGYFAVSQQQTGED